GRDAVGARAAGAGDAFGALTKSAGTGVARRLSAGAMPARVAGRMPPDRTLSRAHQVAEGRARSEGGGPARALVPRLGQHVEQLRDALGRQLAPVPNANHDVVGLPEYPDALRDEPPAVTSLLLVRGQRQHITRLPEALGQPRRQRLASAHGTLQDAVQHLEARLGVAVPVVAQGWITRERGLELTGGRAAVSVLGVAVIALLAPLEHAVAADRRSALHEMALGVTLVVRATVGS